VPWCFVTHSDTVFDGLLELLLKHLVVKVSLFQLVRYFVLFLYDIVQVGIQCAVQDALIPRHWDLVLVIILVLLHLVQVFAVPRVLSRIPSLNMLGKDYSIALTLWPGVQSWFDYWV
jgi:hypothetical protein